MIGHSLPRTHYSFTLSRFPPLSSSSAGTIINLPAISFSSRSSFPLYSARYFISAAGHGSRVGVADAASLMSRRIAEAVTWICISAAYFPFRRRAIAESRNAEDPPRMHSDYPSPSGFPIMNSIMLAVRDSRQTVEQFHLRASQRDRPG